MLSRLDIPALGRWALPATLSIAFAAVWVALAWRTPTSTHHFAPLVAAASWGYLVDLDGPATSRRAALGGVVVALVALLALGLNDRLLGPTLWHSRPSWPELLGFALLGGLITLGRGARTRRSPEKITDRSGAAPEIPK